MSTLPSLTFEPPYKHLPYTKFDFLYGRDGPWPQLMPDRPLGDLPEVVKVPAAEARQHSKHVKRVYLWRLFKASIRGLFYVATHDRYEEFDDERFTRQLTEGVYSKFLVPWPEEPGRDRGIGKALADKVRAAGPEAGLFFCDFSLVECIEDDCLPDSYVAPATVVFRRTGEYRFEPVALKIRSLVLDPSDGQAWRLAKYYALQAAEYSIKFIYHISLHFPFDAVNALTKSVLPTRHIVYKLLMPHLFLSLPVNNAVLESPRSVVCDDPAKSPFYAPFATKAAYVRKMLHLAVDGIDGHAAYPQYDFFKVRPLNRRARDAREAWRTREVPSRFGAVMDRYWPPFYEFAAGVVDHYAERIEALNAAYRCREGEAAGRNGATAAPGAGAAADEAAHDALGDGKEIDLEKLAIWADRIAGFVPGFPRAADIISGGPGTYALDRQVLTETLATILWTVSLAHAMDHVDDARILPNEKPYRLRLPPPQSRNIEAFSRKDLVRRWDFFPSLLILKTFTTPITTLRLIEVDYGFEPASGLRALADRFLANLKAAAAEIEADRTLDRDTPDSDKQWIRLEDVTSSVQY